MFNVLKAFLLLINNIINKIIIIKLQCYIIWNNTNTHTHSNKNSILS